jgi:hypothetical protein
MLIAALLQPGLKKKSQGAYGAMGCKMMVSM